MTEQRSRQWHVLQALLVIVDAFSLSAGLALAFPLRGVIAPTDARFHNGALYIGSGAAMVAGWLAIFAARGLYRRRVLLGGPREYSLALSACCYGMVGVAIAGFVWEGWGVSRIWLGTGFLLAAVLVLLGRFATRRAGYALRRRGWFWRDLVIVGASREGRAIAEHLNDPERTGVRVAGFLDDYLPVGTEVLRGLSVLGRPLDHSGGLRADAGQELLVVPQALSWETMQAVVRAGAVLDESRRIGLAAGFYELLASGVDVDQIARVPVLTLNAKNIPGLYAAAKTALDLAFGLLLFVPAVVLTVGLSVASRAAGLGAAWQGRQLVGRSGRRFTMLVLNAAAIEAHGPTWLKGLAQRPGIKRLPAVFNILRRDISLVGPEARSLEEADLAAGSLASILSVRPGLWSLSVPSEPLDERVKQDVYYVRNFSIMLDLQILARRLFRLAVKLPAGAAGSGVNTVAAALRPMAQRVLMDAGATPVSREGLPVEVLS